MQSEMLLQTKLEMPLPRAHTLARQRLLALIPPTQETRLLLLSAPAGFGKTTLLATWCRELLAQPGTAVAWLALDQRDNDPQRFLAYLITALEQSLSIERHDTHASALAAPYDTTVETVLTALVNTLAASDSNLVLVLDDYHLMRAPAIHAAVAFLLEHLPTHACLAIGSRADPPLPLARLRAREQLFELRAADLRFTPDEIRAFFAAHYLALTAEEVQVISAHVEGWPAGVQLTARALCAALREQSVEWESAPSKLPAGYLGGRLNGSQQHIFAYLADDVFEQQSAHHKAFLLQTSILERMCGSLCDAVLGIVSEEQAYGDLQHHSMRPAAHPKDSYSRLVLEEIEHANVFIMPLDSERRWYRYHHLFRAFLSDQLERESPALIRDLHRRASTWYEQHQLLPDAIDHTLAAGELDHAAALIEPLANTLVAHGHAAKLQQWLAQIPDPMLATRPALSSSAAQVASLAKHCGSCANAKPAHCGWASDAMLEPLSEREQEVLQLIASGASNQAIAQALVISIGTVKSHINHILGKLAARNRTEAVSHARQYGLLNR